MKAVHRAPFLILLLCALAAIAQSQSATENELARRDQARLQALQKGDADALAGFLADDLTYIRPDGSVWDRARYLDAVRSGALKFSNIQHSEQKVRVIGDTGIITGRSDASLTESGRGQQGGAARYTNVYAKQNGEWKLVLMQVTRIGSVPAAGANGKSKPKAGKDKGDKSESKAGKKT